MIVLSHCLTARALGQSHCRNAMGGMSFPSVFRSRPHKPKRIYAVFRQRGSKLPANISINNLHEFGVGVGVTNTQLTVLARELATCP